MSLCQCPNPKPQIWLLPLPWTTSSIPPSHPWPCPTLSHRFSIPPFTHYTPLAKPWQTRCSTQVPSLSDHCQTLVHSLNNPHQNHQQSMANPCTTLRTSLAHSRPNPCTPLARPLSTRPHFILPLLRPWINLCPPLAHSCPNSGQHIIHPAQFQGQPLAHPSAIHVFSLSRPLLTPAIPVNLPIPHTGPIADPHISLLWPPLGHHWPNPVQILVNPFYPWIKDWITLFPTRGA